MTCNNPVVAATRPKSRFGTTKAAGVRRLVNPQLLLLRGGRGAASGELAAPQRVVGLMMHVVILVPTVRARGQAGQRQVRLARKEGRVQQRRP